MSNRLRASIVPLGVEIRLPGWDADRWLQVDWIYNGHGGRTILRSSASGTDLILFDDDVVEVRDGT